MNLSTPDEFIDTVSGHAILGGGFDEEGLHLALDDGRYIFIIGGMVYVGKLEKETLQ